MPEQKPETVYKQSNVFTYSSDYVMDPTFKTLCPGKLDKDTLLDKGTLNDINRDLDTVSINGETVRSIRMKSFTPDELELYSLIKDRKIQEQDINMLRKFLPEDKKDAPKDQVLSILNAQFKQRNEFQNLDEYKQFLKEHLLSEVKDENKKDFLATTLTQNAHQSGFYRAGKAYVGAKMDSLSRAGPCGKFAFLSTISLEQKTATVLSTNEVCVEQYNKEEGILYYRARNEKGEENKSSIIVGNEKGQLSQEYMDFLTDPARRVEIIKGVERPLRSYVSNDEPGLATDALQAFFKITSDRGHTQTKESLQEMLKEDRYVVARDATMNTNLTCKNDTVSLKEVIRYEGVQGMDRVKKVAESVSGDYATVTSQVHISAIKNSEKKSGFDMKFESDGLVMVNKAQESYIKKYFDNAFTDTSALKQMENIILNSLKPPAKGDKPVDPKIQDILFKALTQVGLYQKSQLTTDELVMALDSLRLLAVKNEKQPSFIQRVITKVDTDKNTPVSSLNTVLSIAKGLPGYTHPTEKYKAIINKEAQRGSPSRPSLT